MFRRPKKRMRDFWLISAADELREMTAVANPWIDRYERAPARPMPSDLPVKAQSSVSPYKRKKRRAFQKK